MSHKLSQSVARHALGIFALAAALHLHAQTRFTGAQTPIPTGFSTGGVAVDALGNIFIADVGNKQVVEITPSGPVTIALDGGTPRRLALDTAGNLYVVTSKPSLLRFTVANGAYTTPKTITITLQDPRGIAVDRSGTIYLSDRQSSQIYKYAPAANYAPAGYFITGLNHPAGLAVDLSGNLYIADSGNHRIVVLTPSSGLAGIPIRSGLSSPSDVAVDAQGNVLIADSSGVIYEQPTAGSYRHFLLANNFTAAHDVAFDASGAMYVADSDTQQITKQTLAVNFGSVQMGQTIRRKHWSLSSIAPSRWVR